MYQDKKEGYYPIHVGSVRVSGEKAAAFLNGQFTNDIKNLKSGEANYNLFLTQKGKIIADLTVHRVGDDFLLLIPKPFVAKITEHLSRLAPLSRVTLTDETGKFAVFHTLPEGTDSIVTRDEVKKFLESLRKKGLSELDAAEREIIRVENGIPRVGVDATEENLPQEAGLMRAISLTKGCYLGQEVVARLHYRGHVNRILVGLKIAGGKPSSGDLIFSNGKEVGKITSAVFSPTLNAPLALGYVPYAKKNPGEKYTIGASRREAVVVALPVSQWPS